LIDTGKFTRPWLGVEIRGLMDDPDAAGRNNTATNGVVVKAIIPNGPAANSDLRTGDIITAVDGQPVKTVQQLRGEVRCKTVGKPVTLDVVRADTSMKILVSPGEFTPDAPAPAATNQFKANP
ncbi:MAG TPA: PDZ domain-containing protein, partial [Candidatus Paceibacterota bacterium]|nr:PDZ domain-containing protein [Candidatus Paceibacterota bacterium]